MAIDSWFKILSFYIFVIHDNVATENALSFTSQMISQYWIKWKKKKKMAWCCQVSTSSHYLIQCWARTTLKRKCRNFNHWLHWKLSFWQLPVQPVMKISSKWRHFRFSVSCEVRPNILLLDILPVSTQRDWVFKFPHHFEICWDACQISEWSDIH